MSEDFERILLTNVPDFVDAWVLKSTTPCGDLIDCVNINPSDPSKMMIFTKGQENALKIASTLDNYNLYGSVIRARYAFTKLPETTKAKANSSTANTNSQEDRNVQHDEEVKLNNRSNSSEKTVTHSHNEHSSHNTRIPQATGSQPARGEDETGKLHQDRKRRSSAIVDSTEKLEDARRDESTGRKSSRTSSRGSSRSKESRSRDVLSDSHSKQARDSDPQKSLRCRFCYRSGHATWFCKSYAEYYKVGMTTQGRNPTGCQWPESSIVKVEGLYAGPMIEYMEKCHLQKEKMNREEIRIMFAWLTNYFICYDCGAAGHQDFDRLCKYLPLGRPVTEDMIFHFRKPFCRRMKGIRDQMSFGKLQQCAYTRNNQFRGWLKTKDGGPMTYFDRREEEHSEKPQRVAPPEAELTGDKTEERHNPPATEEPSKTETSVILFAPDGKRIKVEQPDDYEQNEDEDDKETAVLMQQISRIPRHRLGPIQPSGGTRFCSHFTPRLSSESTHENIHRDDTRQLQINRRDVGDHLTHISGELEIQDAKKMRWIIAI